jgi:hypothetical protein
VATRKITHGEPSAPAERGRIPRDATPVQRMARKLQTKAGAAIYATRKGIVEPVLGTDQTRTRAPAILPAGLGEGPRGVGAGLHDAQRVEAVPDLLHLRTGRHQTTTVRLGVRAGSGLRRRRSRRLSTEGSMAWTSRDASSVRRLGRVQACPMLSYVAAPSGLYAALPPRGDMVSWEACLCAVRPVM